MTSIILLMLASAPVSLTETQSIHVQNMEKKLLAPCCYTQSIAEHGSDVAARMRAEVTQMVADGKSEDEIIGHYRAVYGDRVLIVPDGLAGKILFTLPIAASLFACVALFLCLRRMLGSRPSRSATLAPTPPALGSAVRERIRRELEDSW